MEELVKIKTKQTKETDSYHLLNNVLIYHQAFNKDLMRWIKEHCNIATELGLWFYQHFFQT